MPLQLAAPVYKTFELEETDETYEVDEATTVTIKQAAQYEHERRQQLFSTLERKFKELEPDEIILVQTLSTEELKRLEVWLTLVECNILDMDGNPLFPSKENKDGHSRLAMTNTAFVKAWGMLQPDVADEIHNKVLEVNQRWAGTVGEEL